jgi:hypothetical protein
MKKLTTTFFFLFFIIFISCKKETIKEVRVEAIGASYDLKAKDTGTSKEYYNKTNLTGATNFRFSPVKSNSVSVSYITRARISIRIYSDNVLIRNENIEAGSGALFVNK